jgi:hypothetical protein
MGMYRKNGFVDCLLPASLKESLSCYQTLGTVDDCSSFVLPNACIVTLILDVCIH